MGNFGVALKWSPSLYNGSPGPLGARAANAYISGSRALRAEIMLGDEGRPVDSGDGSTRRRDALFGPKRPALNTRIGSRFPLRTRHGPFQDRKVAVVDARAFGSQRLLLGQGSPEHGR